MEAAPHPTLAAAQGAWALKEPLWAEGCREAQDGRPGVAETPMLLSDSRAAPKPFHRQNKADWAAPWPWPQPGRAAVEADRNRPPASQHPSVAEGGGRRVSRKPFCTSSITRAWPTGSVAGSTGFLRWSTCAIASRPPQAPT